MNSKKTISENEFLLSLYTADELIAHENYTEDPHLNDIGLVRMREYIRFDDNVGQACLPFYNDNNWRYFESKEVFVVGNVYLWQLVAVNMYIKIIQIFRLGRTY